MFIRTVFQQLHIFQKYFIYLSTSLRCRHIYRISSIPLFRILLVLANRSRQTLLSVKVINMAEKLSKEI